MPALDPPHWSAILEKAEQWRSANPLARVDMLPRTRRIFDEGARCAYIKESMKPQICSTGAQPCSVCGLYTWSYCETCVLTDKDCPPSPVCTPCDEDGINCPKCKWQGKSWESEKIKHLDTDRGSTMEVSGVTLQDGSFHRFSKILKIPTSEIDTDEDGEIVTDHLMSVISRYAREANVHWD